MRQATKEVCPMNKILIAFSIIVSTLSIHAATVVWGGAADAPGGSPYAEDQIALLLYSGSAFTGVAKSIDGYAIGSTANNGGTVIDTFTLGADYTASEEFYTSYSKPNEGVDGYYAIMIVNEDKTMATYTDMGVISGTDAKTSSVDLKYNEGWEEGYDKYLGEGGYSVSISGSPVPEPTSGLLLLVGIAGMMLRRRRA